MTINIETTVIRHVFQDPAWPLFDEERARQLFDSVPDLSIVSFSTSRVHGDVRQGIECVTEKLGDFISAGSVQSYQWWMFVTQMGLSANKHIVRYKKLWKTLPDWPLDRSKQSVERIFEHPDGVRFAGTASFANEDLASVICNGILLLSERDLYAPEAIDSIYAAAFPRIVENRGLNVDWMSLAGHLCPLGDIVVRVGEEHSQDTWYCDLTMLDGNLSLFSPD